MTPQREQQQLGLKALRDTGYISAVEGFLKSVCAPVFLTSEDGKLNQGSMTLVTGSSGFLGLTARHVADAIKAPRVTSCQLGAGRFPESAHLECHASLDLASFTLSADQLRQSRQLAFTVRSWPLRPLQVGDLVIAGGWPGADRRVAGGKLDVAFRWFAKRLDNISETNLGLVFDPKNSIHAGDDPLPDRADLGGCSGGPVFRLLEDGDSKGIHAEFELAGLIHEYSPLFGVLRAHPLTSLTPIGRFEA